MARPRLDTPNYRLRLFPNGIWRVVWHEDDQPRSVSTRQRDESAAQGFLARFLAGVKTKAQPEQMTIAAILDGYAEDRKEARSAALGWSAKQIKAKLGKLLPADLSYDVIADYTAQRRKEGRSDGTIRRELAGTLRPALAWARNRKWLTETPHIPAPAEPPARDRWLTEEEWDRFIAECKARHVKVYCMALLHTAHRSGAVLELEWAGVDFRRRLIDFGPGHGKKRRSVVPINDDLLPVLEAAYEIRTTKYVVEYAGDKVRSVKTSFRKAAKRAGLPWLHPHLLRHTAATWMIQRGVPLREVARYLGDSEAVTEKRYGKHAPEYLRNASKALERKPSQPTRKPRKPKRSKPEKHKPNCG